MGLVPVQVELSVTVGGRVCARGSVASGLGVKKPHRALMGMMRRWAPHPPGSDPIMGLLETHDHLVRATVPEAARAEARCAGSLRDVTRCSDIFVSDCAQLHTPVHEIRA